jgi:hypothetical protein
LLGIVRPGADEDSTRTCDRPSRIGRPLRILVGELQSIVQAGILAPEQFGPCTLQDLGIANTHVRDVVLRGNLDQVLQIRGVN